MYRVKRFWDTNIDEYEYFIQNIKNKKIIAVTSNKDDADKIVKALEKQIPVNLTLRNSGVCECPNCKTIYSYTEYCSGCGQKLNINSVR